MIPDTKLCNTILFYFVFFRKQRKNYRQRFQETWKTLMLTSFFLNYITSKNEDPGRCKHPKI